MSVYGYARVSSKDQNEARQLHALGAFPVSRERIYIDKQSGKDFARPQYRSLLRRMRSSDTLVIQSIDRLGRNYEEILEQWRILTKERGVSIVVLDMPLLDTRKKERDLTGTFIADLVLQILSYVAETERTFLKKRQAEGIAAAKQRGVRFGAPHKPVPDLFWQLYDRWAAGKISARAAARQLGITHDTFLRWCRGVNPGVK